MKKHLLVAAGLSVFTLASAGAQDQVNSICPAGSSTAGIPNSQKVAQDACQQAADVYQFMAPQLGLALAGGNATLGTGSTLGGFGHFSIGVRVNAFQGSLPDVGKYTQSTNGAVKNPSLATKDQWIGLPTADAAVGIFGGIPLGVTNVGGIDALVSASYVPTIGKAGDDIQITPSSSVQVGYGVRVGLVRSLVVGTSLHTVAVLVAVFGNTVTSFSLGVISEGFTFLFLLPVLFTVAAELDHNGRWAAAANGALFISTGAAPFVLGALIGVFNYPVIGWTMLAATPVGLWAFVSSSRRSEITDP